MAENIIPSLMESKGILKYFSLMSYRLLERAIWGFCELGIADLMADYKLPITALELSQLNGNNWNAECLYRLLRVIADADIVRKLNADDHENFNIHNRPEETIQFQLIEDGLLLTSNHPSKARDMIRFELNPNKEKMYEFLPSIVKFGYQNGTIFKQAFGCGLYEYMGKEENEEYAKLFNNTMIAYSYDMISSMIEIIDFTRFNKLVDIGGGLGTLLSFVLEKHKNLHGILFDVEHVIENAKTISPNEFERKQIESNRYNLVAGDMFKSETIPQADAYILKEVIHNWNDEKCIQILESIRDANKTEMKKVITVFIFESVILSNGKSGLEAHVLDLQMLLVLGSKERTLDEHIDILKKSGYELKRVYTTESCTSIIEAVTTT